MKLWLLSFIFMLTITAAQAGEDEIEKSPAFINCRVSMTRAQRLKEFKDLHGKQIQERGLYQYELSFGEAFLRILRLLKGNQVWMDVGSGLDLAQRQYHLEINQYRGSNNQNSVPRATTYAIDFFDPSETDDSYLGFLGAVPEGKYHFLIGDLFQDIPLSKLPKVALLTDYFGAASYADEFDEVVEKELELLEEGGSLFMNIATSRMFITGANGKTVYTVEQYLKAIEGIKVVKTSDSSFQLIRTKNALSVPKLRFLYNVAKRPPYRFYEWIRTRR